MQLYPNESIGHLDISSDSCQSENQSHLLNNYDIPREKKNNIHGQLEEINHVVCGLP